jgi:hypothetical protein
MNDRNRLGVVYAYYEINGRWNKDALKERASARRCVARGSHIIKSRLVVMLCRVCILS